MKTPRFQVSDKVKLIPKFAGCCCTVPALVPGRVYCVEKVNVLYGNQWLRLVGVREHRYKCCDDRGPVALAFELVSRVDKRAKKGGA